MKYLLPAFLATLLLMLQSSCEQDDDEDVNIRSSIDFSIIELGFSRIILLALHNNPGGNDFSGLGTWTCAAVDSVAGDTAMFPDNGPVTIYLNFPDTGCTDIDQRRKAGRVALTYHDDIWNTAAIAEVQFDDLMVGPGHYRGQVNIGNTGSNMFEVAYVDCELYSGTSLVEYAGSATVTHASDNSTVSPEDDEYAYVSTINGVDKEGTSFLADATTSIIMHTACAWNPQGEFAVEPDGRDIQTIEHGNGDCDHRIKVTAEGQEVFVLLP